MARRSLLTGDERRRLFEPPVTDREVARFYTLSPVDLEWLEERRGPANKLGAAMQMALLRQLTGATSASSAQDTLQSILSFHLNCY